MNFNKLQFRPRLSRSAKKAIQKNYDTLTQARTKRLAQINKSVSRIGKEARQQFKSLVTKQELKAGKALADEAKIAIAKLFLPKKANVTPAKIKSIKREFNTAFPNIFKQRETIQKLRAKHRGDVEKGFAHIEEKFGAFDHVIADILDVNALPQLQVTSFKPPFAFSEMATEGVVGDITRDDSFTDTQSGFLLHDFDFRHSGGGSFNPIAVRDHYTAMGLRFTLPATGVLKVTCVMHNTLNLLQASIHDNFGFSEGNVRMSDSILMDVLHPNNLEMSEKFSLAFLSLSSGGDDVSKSESDLQTITPYVITLISTGAFSVGETVDLLVGSHVHIRSSLDDMTCNLRARIGWQVKEVFVEVI